MLTLDAATRAEYDAQSLAADKGQAVVDALADPVAVKVYDETDAARASGTMDTPWATVVGDRIVIGEVTSFAVTSGAGGAIPAGWTLRFESGARSASGSFGHSGTDFTWSLPTFETGQGGYLGTVELVPQGNVSVQADYSPSWSVGAAVTKDIVLGWTVAAAGSSPLTFSGVPNPIPLNRGGTYDLSQHVTGGVPPYSYDHATYSLPTGVALNFSNGLLSANASATLGVSANIDFGVTDSASSGSLSATATLVSAAGPGKPFSFGYAFGSGDVPAGSYVTVTGTGLEAYQVKVLSTWRDGSARFAVVSGTYTSAGTPVTLTLGTTLFAPGGSSITIADLKATGVSAAISFGAYGSVSWSGADWDSPLLQHVSGPIMSSWVFRKALPSDSHATAWLEVRLYAGGAVQVLPWLENGYLKVASPGTRSGTATFTLGGTERFNASLTIPHHCRTVLCSGSTFWHWLGSDPGVTWKHDTAYLMDSKLVPEYFAGPSETILNGLSQTYTPLGQHDYPASMGAAGYDGSIGLLTEWDAEYLVSGGDVRAWKSVIVNGYASGRYGIHYRDETTQRVPICASYPNLVLNSTNSGTYSIGNSETSDYTPTPGGVAPATYTNSHVPAFGFMPYLLTGLWYFMDEMQHAAFFPYLKNTDATRDYGSYMLETAAGANQIRGAAWALRTIAQAAAMTSDADTAQKIQWRSVVEHNASVMHARYVAQPNNPLGLCQNDDERYWMDDFYTAVWGYVKDLAVQQSGNDAKVSEFCAYKYQSPVGRLGLNSAGNWSYRKAVQYDGVSSPVGMGGADWNGGTGPWYADWGAAYVAYGLTYDAGDTLLGSYADEYAFAQSYWGNLMPAIAYAVDHGATGASDAYARLTGASNWLANKAFFTDYGPQWAIKPRSVA